MYNIYIYIHVARIPRNSSEFLGLPRVEGEVGYGVEVAIVGPRIFLACVLVSPSTGVLA